MDTHKVRRSVLLFFMLLFVFIPLMITCSVERNKVQQMIGNNAVYYWKTTWMLSDEERKFLDEHHIRKIYLRYFDVYAEKDNVSALVPTPVPQATIRFKEPVPQDVEIIPTVFIDNNLFRYGHMSDYFQKLVDRILIMSETNDIENVREVQLDCDGSQTTESADFNFLEDVNSQLTKNKIELSVTIRLHQLRMKARPVPRGVPKCYDTGALRHYDTGNSILSAADVAPYASYLKNYKLSLDIAYPTFSWAAWFSHDGHLKALLRDANPADTCLIQVNGNKYRVKYGFYQEGHYLAVDNRVRFEVSDFKEIMLAKKMLEHQPEGFTVIIYHLDSANLSKYTKDELDKIYNVYSDI